MNERRKKVNFHKGMHVEVEQMCSLNDIVTEVGDGKKVGLSRRREVGLSSTFA